MAAYRFVVNGVNISDYIAHDGLKWTRNDIEAPDAGRDMYGDMHRGRVATKIRLDVTCRPLKSSELMIVLRAILAETFTVKYYDPQNGQVTKTMYSNNNPAQCKIAYDDTRALWTGITFPLIEV